MRLARSMPRRRYERTRLARRLGAGEGDTSAVGLRFSSTAQYALGTAGHYSGASKTWCIRFLENAAPPVNATAAIVGQGDFGATGFVFVSYGYPGQPTARGGFQAYAGGVYTRTNLGSEHVGTPTDAHLARKVYRTAHVWIEGGRSHVAIDGEELSTGGTTAVTDFGSAAALAINRRSSSVANQYGDVTIVEIQSTDAGLSRREIRAHARTRAGTPMRGSLLHHFMASDLGSPGSTPAGPWKSRINASHTLALTGSPSLVRVGAPRAGAIVIEVRGDSIAAGRDLSGTTNEGWRRSLHYAVSAVRSCFLNGRNTFTAAGVPLDFDARHTAVPARGLGATPAGGPTDLSVIDSDPVESRWLYVQRRAATVCAFGINDITRRVTELAQTPAAAVAAMATDWGDWIRRVRHARSGPIFIVGTLREADASSTANERTAVDSWNAGLPALVAQWNATYGDVYFYDVHARFVAAFGATYYNDTTTVMNPDGTHLRPAANTVYGEGLASVVLAAGDPVDDPAEIFGDSLTLWCDHLSDTRTGAAWSSRLSSTAVGLSQGTGTYQPTAGTAISTRPTLLFDGSDDRMDHGTTPISSSLSASAFGVWLVGRVVSLGAGPTTQTGSPGWFSDTAGYMLGGVATSAAGVLFDVAHKATSPTLAMEAGAVYRARLRFGAGTARYAIKSASGEAEASVASGNLGALTGFLRVGASYLPGTGAINADVGAFVAVKREPTAAELAAMDAWTSRVWGV